MRGPAEAVDRLSWSGLSGGVPGGCETEQDEQCEKAMGSHAFQHRTAKDSVVL